MLGTLAFGGLGACDDAEEALNNPTNRALIEEGEAMGRELAAVLQRIMLGQPESVIIASSGDVVAAINEGEILQAELALGRANDVGVRELAQRILQDHTLNQRELEAQLANRGLGLRPNEVSERLRDEAMAGLAPLEATPQEAFDLAYATMQVRMHATGRVLVQEANDLVADTEFSRYLDETRNVIQQHLDEAAIQVDQR
jgi:predicted outer membrane protein